MISTLYAAAARRRREWYARRPHLRRRLRRPVISIGNLAVGGRGKTPVTAAVARLLLALGERPAILSRGYARAQPDDGVVVVRDRDGIRADLARAGDEPLMLARQLPGVAILVSSDRYLAGRLAEHHLGCTVHVLDDGFQHLHVDRDSDVVLLGAEDVETPVTLPAGRLREPLDALAAADAIVTTGAIHVDALEPAVPMFRVRRVIGPVVTDDGTTCSARQGSRVLALAGIAGPERFFEDLGASGWDVAKTLVFQDHHPYTRRDLARIDSAARAAGAVHVVTTEKDYVRLLPLRPFPLPVAWVPLTMEPDPLPLFTEWLAGSLRDARDITLG